MVYEFDWHACEKLYDVNNGKQIFVSAPKFEILIVIHYDKSMKSRIAAKTLRRDYKLCDRGGLK